MKYISGIYYLFIALFIVFPSSLLFSLKMMSFLLLLLSFFYVIGRDKIPKGYILYFLFMLKVLIIFFMVGFFKETVFFEQGILAFRVFITFFFLLFITYYYGEKKVINFQTMIKVVLYSCFLYMVLKIFLMIFMMFFNVEAKAIKEIMPGVVIQQFYGSPLLTRVVSASDIINAFLFVFIMVIPSLKKEFNYRLYLIYLFLSIFLMIQSYTRYVWLVCLLSIFVRLFVISKSKIENALKSLIVLLGCGIIFNLCFPTQVDLFVELLDIKFSDTTSLDTKSIQSKYLFEEFLKHPLLGKGLGSCVEYYIRDYKQLFQYETQIFSFLMQFGIFGFFIFISPILLIILPLVRKNKVSLILLFFYLLWLASGFTNPYLTILACISIYCLFILYPKNKLNENN